MSLLAHLQSHGTVIKSQLNHFSQDFSKEDIVTDTRKIHPNCIFIAYKGVKIDSHQFINELDERVSIVIFEDPNYLAQVQGRSFILVDSSRKAWALLCQYYSQYKSGCISLIGVTGTNGKTSTTFFIHQLLKSHGIKSSLIGTLGAFIGSEACETKHTSPDPPEIYKLLDKSIESGCQYFIVEVSAHGLDQHKFAGLKFDYMIYTSFSQDHLDHFKNMKEYFATKLRFLFEYQHEKTKYLINKNLITTEYDPEKKIMGLFEKNAKNVFSYGYENESFALKSKSNSMENSSPAYFIQGPVDNSPVFLPTFDIDFLLENLTAAVSTFFLAMQRWPEGQFISKLQTPPGRMQTAYVGQHKGIPKVYIDYAHTPDGLEKALQCLKQHAKGRFILVFGCGGDRDQSKRPIMGAIAERFCSDIIITNDNPRSENEKNIADQILNGIKNKTIVSIELDRKKAIQNAIDFGKEQDTILIAGKGHEDYQIIAGQTYYFSDYELAIQCLTEKVRGN